MSDAVVLIGFKSSGKSTYGAMLAKSVGGRFADLDRLLEQAHASCGATMCPAHQIFRDFGSAYFARLEERALVEYVRTAANEAPGAKRLAVLATTGATPLSAVNLALLRRLGPVVLIDTPREVIRQRWFSGRLPAFVDPGDPQASFDRLYAERAPLYSAAADEVVATANRRDEEVLADILAIARRAGVKAQAPE
ncbi:shikimate kinase [Variovorax sp. YR752]|uniref:shikimate kinase n=1 Tax=Variovorax sp. YR752 TaxID=1884383 RepID=UPI000BC51A77|nr:shikimate kinase [Variovorax sp. YR752]SOE06241.1 shikimate kinase [Variovorax sp. YR752]